MEAARPRRRRRRPRRGTVDRPLNVRLVRVSSILVLPAFLALLFSISPTGTLPRPALEPVFDPEAAVALADELSSDYPSRIPGSPESADAARWFSETVASFGFAAEEDRWTEDLAELGVVELRNVVAVIPGRSEEAIVLVAHRDNGGPDRPRSDNASGTAALIELARGYAPRGASVTPQPRRAIVLVSTDGGAYGGAGARRFATESPYADNAFAAVVLDGLGGRGPPSIAIAGDDPRSPAPAFVRTAVARVQEQVGLEPSLPGVPTQLVSLGIPYADGEQGRFLASGIAALTITRDEPDANAPAGASETLLSEQHLGELGRAAESLLSSIDESVGAAFRTPDSLFLGGRVASGWAVRLTLLVAVVPFALGALDLFVRGRRRQLPLNPAARALRARAFLWLYAGFLLWLAGLVGVLPTGASLPVPTDSAAAADWPLAGVGLLAVALLLGWLGGRRRLIGVAQTSPEERLAGYVVAFTWLTAVSVLIGLVHPYALAFVLPSLYAWIWLPLTSRLWARASLYLIGFSGPVAGLAVLAAQLELNLLDTLLYVAKLATVGYVSPLSVLLALAWATAATQLAALAFGRYAPYAAGAEPPPPGPLLTATRKLAARARGNYARAR